MITITCTHPNRCDAHVYVSHECIMVFHGIPEVCPPSFFFLKNIVFAPTLQQKNIRCLRWLRWKCTCNRRRHLSADATFTCATDTRASKSVDEDFTLLRSSSVFCMPFLSVFWRAPKWSFLLNFTCYRLQQFFISSPSSNRIFQILRHQRPQIGNVLRPRDSKMQRRHVDLGQYRYVLPPLQQHEGTR